MYAMSDSVPRPELLTGFREALRLYGWNDATMERIARAAGVSRVTLHRQGVKKDALFAALLDNAVERYREAMWPALTDDGPAAQRMEAALVALCELAETELELLVALRAQSDAIFHEADEGEQLTRSVFTEPLERILRDGARDGTLAADDPTELATVLFNLVGWTYVHLRTGHGWSAQRARRATLDVALGGVLTR